MPKKTSAGKSAESKQKSLPNKIHREGAHLWFGNMWVATVHEDIDLIRAAQDPAYLTKFGEKNKDAVLGPRNPFY